MMLNLSASRRDICDVESCFDEHDTPKWGAAACEFEILDELRYDRNLPLDLDSTSRQHPP